MKMMRSQLNWMNVCVPGMEWILRPAGKNWLLYFLPSRKSMTRLQVSSLPENGLLRQAAPFFP